VRDRLRRPESSLHRLDDVDLGIREECVQVVRAALGIPCDVVVAIPHAVGELDSVAARFPPLDAAEDVRTAVVRTCGGSHADRAALGKRLPEACCRDHLQTRTVCAASASRPRTSEATAVRTWAPLRLPCHVISYRPAVFFCTRPICRLPSKKPTEEICTLSFATTRSFCRVATHRPFPGVTQVTVGLGTASARRPAKRVFGNGL